ncbi:unnamed protein product [Meganyctiphanes norvegica]|uniref:C2H2-type domain-containing protein n=1 Tax=Meganyctiphanes norvegica TaxID=48144 RepID=A0AAV2SG22_MEGNR
MELGNNNNYEKNVKIIQTVHGDFSPRAQSRMTKMEMNNKISKEKDWGEFELIFGNRHPDNSDLIKNKRKLKFSYFVLSLKTENVSILKQQIEYLRLGPKEKYKGFTKYKEECDDVNSMDECHQCGYKTNKDLQMLEHMMTHTEEYYLCEKCDAKYSNLIELRKHIMSHTSYLPFACSECDFFGAKPEEIQNHCTYHKT